VPAQWIGGGILPTANALVGRLISRGDRGSISG